MNKKILILSANPRNTAQLRLDKEVREIDEGLRRSRNRDYFSIEQKWAIRITDLRRALLDHEPQIVHFCGHGEVDGLMVEDDSGNAVTVDSKGLAGLFELFNDQVECVLLNACYSEEQAKAINQHIPYVIGMSNSIGDKAALEFSLGFYDALGAGRTYKKAFQFGSNAIQLHGIEEHVTPVFLEKPGASDNQKPIDKASASPASGSEIGDRAKARNPKLYDLLSEKISRLENAYALETDPARKFQLENQLEEAQKDLQKMMTDR